MDKFDFDSYDYKRNILLTWPTGVGKTYKAKELLKNFKDPTKHEKLQTYSISDAKFKQLVKSHGLNLRKPEEYNSRIEDFPLEMMTRAWVLLYDDIGVSDTTEAYLRDLTYILDERIEKKLVTIYTTNLKKTELQEKLNERILSRILYNTDVIIFDWEDKRTSTTNYFTN